MMGSVIDISTNITAHMAIYPGDPAPNVRALDGPTTMSELVGVTTHTGTHVDAPAHVLADGTSMKDIPLDRFIRPVHVVRCPLPEVTVKDLAGLNLPPRTGVLFCTADRFGGHISEAAAEAIAAAGIDLVGIDSVSVDQLLNNDLPIHKQLLRRDIVIIEHLELRHVTPGNYVLHALPMAIDAPDGAPTRAILTAAAQ